MIKQLLVLAAPIALTGLAAAQQNLYPLPASADLVAIPASQSSAAALPVRATTGCDDFNTGGSILSNDWLGLNGTPGIVSDAYAALVGGNTHAQYLPAAIAYDQAVISFDLDDNPQTLIYGAGSMGIGGSSDNLYVKIQRNGFSPGLFDTVGFYTGNGSNTSGSTGWGGFFGLTTPVAGGIITIYIDPNSAGDVLMVDIDENRDGVVDQTLIAQGSILAGFPAGTLGTGIGLGCYGDGVSRCADDFELNGGCAPQGPTLASSGSAGSVMTFDFANFGAGEQIAVVYGPAGPFAGNAPCGPVNASLIPLNPTPAQGLIVLVADGAGVAQLVQNVPAAGAGLLVQALAMTSCDLTNTVTL
jgi:hypothetical protein